MGTRWDPPQDAEYADAEYAMQKRAWGAGGGRSPGNSPPVAWSCRESPREERDPARSRCDAIRPSERGEEEEGNWAWEWGVGVYRSCAKTIKTSPVQGRAPSGGRRRGRLLRLFLKRGCGRQGGSLIHKESGRAVPAIATDSPSGVRKPHQIVGAAVKGAEAIEGRTPGGAARATPTSSSGGGRAGPVGGGPCWTTARSAPRTRTRRPRRRRTAAGTGRRAAWIPAAGTMAAWTARPGARPRSAPRTASSRRRPPAPMAGRPRAVAWPGRSPSRTAVLFPALSVDLPSELDESDGDAGPCEGSCQSCGSEPGGGGRSLPGPAGTDEGRPLPPAADGPASDDEGGGSDAGSLSEDDIFSGGRPRSIEIAVGSSNRRRAVPRAAARTGRTGRRAAPRDLANRGGGRPASPVDEPELGRRGGCKAEGAEEEDRGAQEEAARGARVRGRNGTETGRVGITAARVEEGPDRAPIPVQQQMQEFDDTEEKAKTEISMVINGASGDYFGGIIEPSSWHQTEQHMMRLDTVPQSTGIPLLLALLMTMTQDLIVAQHTSLFEADRGGLIGPSFWLQTERFVILLELVSQSKGMPLLSALIGMMTTDPTEDRRTSLFEAERCGLIKPSSWRQMEQQMMSLEKT
ncbi:hypothetical protein THAOC_32928 [Thalassiosira oceanica]|uniref:Uncharacterized protein n=1 Tax=Thalassiosira oceanica TaxID=159749 RepID=K0RNG3_THAOC|nr:hypothetical protein THAOC_32928 [Thalassiosira oceanica]|eukprot:EJK48292.1 hypothetical protein THAOC_32928 [Thalassiosira oceanica]